MIHLVIPKTHEGHRGAGQWKDLQGIRLVLNRVGSDGSEFLFDGSNTDELIARIGDAADSIIWYYSFWPEAMETLRRRCPRVRLVLRTVNAEALQHWVRAGKDWRRWRGLPRDIYGFFRLLRRDRRCARAAHALAGISPWDDVHYWRRWAHRDTVRTVPYFCPWPALLPEVAPRPWAEREDVIVCLAGARDAIGRGHIEGFASLARRPEFSSWRFLLSAGLKEGAPDRMSDRVESIGRIEEPWELLCRAKAVALLSPLGYGYKTTATDARAAGCQVLIHPSQYLRLTPRDRESALPVDPAHAAGWGSVIDLLSRQRNEKCGSSHEQNLNDAAAEWKMVCRL